MMKMPSMTHLPLRRALSIAGIVVCATLPSTAVFAQEAQSAQGDDVGLLCVADQADRDSKNPDWNGRQVDWAKVRPRDAQRRQDLRRLMHDGRVHSAADDACAGLIFQHGESVDDARLAYAMFHDMYLASGSGNGLGIFVPALLLLALGGFLGRFAWKLWAGA